MPFKIIKIGKVKNSQINKLAEYYLKLIGKYDKIQIIELKEQMKKERSETRKYDGERFDNYINSLEVNVLLDENGKTFTSTGFAEFLRGNLQYGKKMDFFIAGPFGIEESHKNKFDLRLSLSPMTFPHELAYVILLEQIFRSMKILHNEDYNY